MKAKVKKLGEWAAGAVVLSGLIYSVLGLTLNARPVYAASCDCVEAEDDAGEYCLAHTGSYALSYFECPLGTDPNQYTRFQCQYGGLPFTLPCSF